MKRTTVSALRITHLLVHKTTLRLLALLIISISIQGNSARAAERTWDGGGRSPDWTDSLNWTTLGGAPVAGDDLRFPAGVLRLSNNNDFPTGTDLNRLTFTGAGYTITGNEIDLAAGIVVSHGSGNTILNLPLGVAANQTFLVSVAGANLFLNGAVNLGGARPILTFDGAGQTVVSGNITDGRVFIGGGTLRKIGAGTLYVLQNLTFGGPTMVNGGTLIMDGRMSNSAVTVNATGTLRGSGKVGGLIVNSGGTVGPGLNSPNALDSLGDVALNAGSTLNLRLNGTSAGLNYDQLRVHGALTLGGNLNVTASFIPAVGQRFTIIDNDGTDDTVGTFDGLPEGATLTMNGRPFRISYGSTRGGLGGILGRDVNDVTLEAIPALAVWDGGGDLNKFWTQPLNWINDTPPMPGDDVQFVSGGSATLTSVNDFPSGSVFGSLIFGQGQYHLEGDNMALLQGAIQILQSNDVAIVMPLTMKGTLDVLHRGRRLLGGPVTLSGNQTFRTTPTNTIFWLPGVGLAQPFLSVTGQINLAGHELVIETEPAFAFDELSSSVLLSGQIVGPGTFSKRGGGELHSFQAIFMAPVSIYEGVVFGGQYPGNVLVNTGAVLRAFGGGQNVEVRGGTLIPQSADVNGTTRFLDGALFVPTIHYVRISPTEGYPTIDGLSVHGPVELANGNLNVQLDSLPESLERGMKFFAIKLEVGGSVTGTFNGLPEGGKIAAGGYVFTVSYVNGVSLQTDLPFIWDGGGSGNVWGTAANWEADFAPVPNADLIFPANVSKVAMINGFAEGTRFRSMTFTAPSYLLVGNSLRITEGIYNDVASGDTRISLDVLSFGNITSRVSNASRLIFEGRISSSTWTKTGTGTMRFTGMTPNDLPSVHVEAGELELDKSPGVDAISNSLYIGDGVSDVRVILLDEHQIADDALVTVKERARLDLNGHDEAIGSLLGEGTVSLDSRLGAGRSGGLTVRSGSFSGAIVGQGGLTKTGPFQLSLLGDSTYSGLTLISEGVLVIDGTLTSSPIRLNGGTLRGRGTVETITANLGGTIQPGSGGADFMVALHSRDVHLNSSTIFRTLLTSSSPDYENHKLKVTGTVDLGGSTLIIDLLNNFKPTNQTFVIIENDGTDPIVGTFAGLPEGAVLGGDGLPFRISYVGGTGNDVVLTRVSAPASTLTSIITLSNRQMRIEGLGMFGVSYPIQAASNLNPVIYWTNIGNATGDASGLFRFIDTGATNRSMRFYRAVSP